MTKTERKKQQTREIIQLLESKFKAKNFDNDQGSYFTFFVGEFEGALYRNNFSVIMYDNRRMSEGFTDEEYAIRDAANLLEYSINKEIRNYLNK